MKKILVTGSLAYDFIMDYPDSFADHIIPEKIKTLSVSFDLDHLSRNFGGNAGNIAYTLAILQQDATIFSSAGKKDFGIYGKHLKKHKIVTDYINLVADDFTASAFGMTDKNNCQIWGFYPGALKKNANLSLLSLPNLSSYSYIVLAPPQDAETIIQFTREAKKTQLPYMFSPGQKIANMTSEQIKEGITGAALVLLNDYELAMINKKTGWGKMDILKKTEIFILTLGAEGSVVETKQESIQIGIVKPKKIIDPTGAGDSYIAGFLAGHANGLDLKTCGQIGATAATYTIENYGTQQHAFTLNEFKKRYTDTFGESLLM
ncbi:MAG: carbohydrate kinase family protein [Candidatus Levybacteria bacterium]|nr:carbohydrate kinase family protein [Candidatus Levybacteria bacterium]